MRIIDRTMPSSFEIALFGDSHHGSTLCHEKGIDNLIDWTLQEKHRYLIHMGDWCEAILTDDKRFQHDTTTNPIPSQQRDYVIKRYAPVKKRILVGLIGNHEFKLHRYGNLAAEICQALGTEYGTYSCVLCLKDKKGPLFNMYLAHGWRSLSSNAKDWEQRQANMKAALKMQLRFKAGDCLVQAVGHSHKLLIAEPTVDQLYLTHSNDKVHAHYLGAKDVPAGGYIHPDLRWYLNTGSYLKLYGDDGVSGYAERKIGRAHV
jgi:hypothetical protein